MQRRSPEQPRLTYSCPFRLDNLMTWPVRVRAAVPLCPCSFLWASWKLPSLNKNITDQIVKEIRKAAKARFKVIETICAYLKGHPPLFLLLSSQAESNPIWQSIENWTEGRKGRKKREPRCLLPERALSTLFIPGPPRPLGDANGIQNFFPLSLHQNSRAPNLFDATQCYEKDCHEAFLFLHWRQGKRWWLWRNWSWDTLIEKSLVNW